MIRLPLMIIALTGLAASGAAGAKAPKLTPEQEIAKAVAGRYPGKPVDCLPFSANDSESFKGAILYKPTATWYLNRFDDSCPNYDDDSILVTKSPIGRLCRGDIATLLDRSSRITRGSCVLGSFTPYSRTPPRN